MTPFAQLEKSAAIDLKGLGSIASRALKGFRSAPSDFASLVSGRGIPTVANELGTAGQAGNLIGHGMIGTGLLSGANALNDKLTKKPGGEQKPNGGHPLGAVHPDLKKQWEAQGTPNGPGYDRLREMMQIGMQSGMDTGGFTGSRPRMDALGRPWHPAMR